MIHPLGSTETTPRGAERSPPQSPSRMASAAHHRRSAVVGDSIVTLAAPRSATLATAPLYSRPLAPAGHTLADLRLQTGQLLGADFPDIRPRQGLAEVPSQAFDPGYPASFEGFWARNIDTLQTLAETDILQFALSHRRADERARALGLGDQVAARLKLSDQALGMLAEASGKRDPDLRAYGTRAYALDINGYAADDITWLRARDGHVVLIMPDDERHVREYASLGAMRDDIRAMLQSAPGRQQIARHFSSYNRADGVFYQGVDQWLLDIAGGHYDDRIARSRARPGVDLGTALGQPDARGSALLSDRALAMLCEAAGQPDAGLGAQGTQAFVFDINTYQSSDMRWLRAADGHVVLIMPGSQRPVREYPDVEAMRTAVADMTRTEDGRRELAHHFSVYNRRDGVLYQGVDQWLVDLGDGLYNRRIAYLPQYVTGNVFRHQVVGSRDADLDKLRYLSQAKASSHAEEQRWIADFEVARQPFSRLRADDAQCSQDAAGRTAERHQRSLPDDFVQACQRTRQRAGQWARSLQDRLLSAIDRLRHASPPTPMPTPQPAAVDTAAPPQADTRTPNERGWLESHHFGVLYRYIYVTPHAEPHGAYRRDPTVLGFPPQYRFAAGRQTMDGDVMDAYLTPEAARRAIEVASHDRRYYWLYEIDARGLRGVSFGDNRVHNPDYQALMADDGWDTLVRVAESIFVAPYSTSGYRAIEDQIVQLQMEGDMSQRTVRVSGRFIN